MNLRLKSIRYSIRTANIKDSELILNWRNEPTARRSSINKKIIKYEEHIIWYRKVLNSDNIKLFIFTKSKIPVGMVRFEKEDNKIKINYLVDLNYRNRGIGYKMLSEGIKKIKKIWSIDKLEAVVLDKNKASQKILERIGFSYSNTKNKQKHYKLNLVG